MRHRSVSGSSGDDSPLLRSLKAPATPSDLRLGSSVSSSSSPVRSRNQNGGKDKNQGGASSSSGNGRARGGVLPGGPGAHQKAELRDVTGGGATGTDIRGQQQRYRSIPEDDEDEEIIMYSDLKAGPSSMADREELAKSRLRLLGVCVVFTILGLLVSLIFGFTLFSTPREISTPDPDEKMLSHESVRSEKPSGHSEVTSSSNIAHQSEVVSDPQHVNSMFPVAKKSTVDGMRGELWTGGVHGGPKVIGLSKDVQRENAQKDPRHVERLLQEAGVASPSSAQKRIKPASPTTPAQQKQPPEQAQAQATSKAGDLKNGKPSPGHQVDEIMKGEYSDGAPYDTAKIQPLSNDKEHGDTQVNVGQPAVLPPHATVDFGYYWEMPDLEKLVNSGSRSRRSFFCSPTSYSYGHELK